MALRATHIFTSEALVSGYLYFTKAPMPVSLVSVLGIWIGAQLPDLDTGETPFNKRLGPVGRIIGKIFRHRTWTHSLWAVIGMFALAGILPVASSFNSVSGNYLRILYVMIAVGYFLHLLEDSFSYQGICWLYPFQRFQRSRTGHWYRKRPWHFFYYRTGGYEEVFLRYVSLIIMLYFFIKLFEAAYLK